MNDGPLRFARYAYPPNALGYCGPADPAALKEASVAGDLAELAHLATSFDGAWPYLELIAGCNGIEDPLDSRVVEAYWVGNELLAGISNAALICSLDQRFYLRTRGAFGEIAMAVPLGGIPHHNFHVFAVYPWLGLLRSGTEGPALTVLDQCRIRWGRVEEIGIATAVVRTAALEFDSDRLIIGRSRTEEVRRSAGGIGSVELHVGDIVSLHWDWVCEPLSPRSLAALRHTTRRNLDAVNATERRGPLVAANTWGG